MRRVVAAVAVMSLASAWSSASYAQTNVVQEPDRTEVAKVTRITFEEGAQVQGNLHRPADTFISVRTAATFANRIKVRGNFVPELERSADNL